MKNNYTRFLPNHLQIFTILLALILVLGISFRFVNIEQKSYWDDEAFTSLRISGYTEYTVVEKVASIEKISVKDLKQYQNINAEKNLFDTLHSLALEDPQHPPAYYVITWIWVHLFGNSITAFRTISAVLSLLVFPAVYWLCRELFDSLSTGLIAIGIMAVSPFHILYAQEARQYSLWTGLILLSSASLLTAKRLNTKLSWGIYAAILAFSFYTFPSSIIVAAAHGVYLITIEKWRFTKGLISYILAVTGAFILFMPWIFVILASLKHINKIVGGQGSMPRLSLIKTWAFNLSRIFIDSNQEGVVINFGFENPITQLFQIFLVGLLVLLSGYAVYFVCRYTAKETWIFILSLILITSLPIIGKDLISGGSRSIILRYFIPAYLGIQICIAYLLANGIISKPVQARFWKVVICLLFTGAIFSNFVSFQASSWWTKSHSDVTYQAAKFINQAEKPLLISDGSMGMILALSHQLKPEVQLQLKPYCHTCREIPNVLVNKNILTVADGFDNFLFAPSESLLQEFNQMDKYLIQPVSSQLWQIKDKN
ncbi:MAG TPA: glycosyltransferase family 39 protein [Nostocaceae cyanobacterium]|nr:glycosyltransferase family 39 protein [Nostocaceae cyanobacterium]